MQVKKLLWSVALLVAVAACVGSNGGGGPVGAPRPSPSSDAVVSTQPETPLLLSAPARFELGECLIEPEDWFIDDASFAVSDVAVGERFEVSSNPWNGLPAIVRTITLTSPTVLFDRTGQRFDSIVEIQAIEAVAGDSGVLVGMTGIDYDVLADLDDVVVMGRLAPDDSGVLLLVGVFGRSEAGTDLAGPCTGSVGAFADHAAPELGYADGVELLKEWSRVRGTPAAQPIQDAEQRWLEERQN
jgi:hypothetical protein